ncbi:MAG TPA: FecR domain-containing protein [Rhodopila sp.]
MSSSNAGKPRDPVTEAALDWFMRCHAREAGSAPDRDFDAWLRAAPEHAAAYARVEALWHDPGFAAAIAIRRLPVRRRRVAPVLLRIAASVAVFAVLGVGGLRIAGVPVHLPADYATNIGAARVDQLGDGTRLVLDSASAVDVSFSETQRTVQLREGRAFFAVAADARPFEVVAGDVVIRDVGTSFSVDRFDGAVRVTVRQGEVALLTGGHGSLEQHLHAREEGGYRAGHLIAPATIDPQIAFAWLDNRLFFQRRPLGEVVDALRRYHRGWIVIANPGLRSLKVSGGYNLSDPVGAIRDLARLSGASLTQVSDRLLILR